LIAVFHVRHDSFGGVCCVGYKNNSLISNAYGGSIALSLMLLPSPVTISLNQVTRKNNLHCAIYVT
jgi:hypothetical protein